MNLDRLHTLAVVERIARVRESECRQQLVDAAVSEAQQRERVDEVLCQQQLGDAALKGLCSHEVVDVARLSMYHDIANVIDSTLCRERNALEEREALRETRAQILVGKTLYLKGVVQRIDHATCAQRAALEAHEADDRLEAWVLRAIRKANHV